MKKKILISALTLVGFFQQSNAQTASPAVKQKQKVQQHRIAEGINSGSITPQEAAHLEHQQAKIQHDKKVAKSDGIVTPAEKAKLHHEQKKASHHINRAKHNAKHQ